MAVLTAQGISSLAIELLTRLLVLPMTASRVPGGEFAGSNGDTITVRVPQPSTARTQSTPGGTITYDDVDEVAVDVTLAHLYHAKLVSDEELSLNLEDFGRQITRVQIAAVATQTENQIATVMNNLSSDLTVEVDGSNIDEVILEARELLGRNDVPLTDRWLAVSPEVATFLLAADLLARVDASGSSSALREAIIGRYRGFTVVESSGLSAGRAAAYHQSGFAFANRVPVSPRGATSTATAEAGGIGMRQIFQYVPDKLSDATVVSTFAGAVAVPDNDSGTEFPRIVVLETATS